MAALEKFAKCFTGYTYRSPPKESPTGEFTILYPKDINTFTNTLDYSNVLKTNDFEGDPKYKLSKGDILIASKGKSNPVAAFIEDINDVVATSAFIIIRITNPNLHPLYVAWYLEQPDVQSYFISRKSGTTVLNLPIKALQDLEVPILPLDQQNIFAELYLSRNQLKATQLAVLKRECQLIDLKLSKKLNQYCK